MEQQDIPGFEGRYAATRDGHIYSHHRKRFMRPYKNKAGYWRVSLTKSDGSRGQQGVHRLIALTFLPNPNLLPFIDHIDSNKFNNRLDNLRWCTHQQNVAWAMDKKVHIAARNRRFTDEDVRTVRGMYKMVRSTRRIAAFLGIPRMSVENVIGGKTYVGVK